MAVWGQSALSPGDKFNLFQSTLEAPVHKATTSKPDCPQYSLGPGGRNRRRRPSSRSAVGRSFARFARSLAPSDAPLLGTSSPTGARGVTGPSGARGARLPRSLHSWRAERDSLIFSLG